MPNVVFLPGFMQHADSWSPIAAVVAERYPVTLVDFTTWTFEERLGEIEAAASGAVLVGYSMGGRLALHAALRTELAGVVTIGASAGIDEPEARERRRAADEELAEWIETQPINAVVDRWEQNPVFASQSPELVEAQRPGRLDHEPAKLATLLRSAGQGALEPIWDELPQIQARILALAGEHDEPYRAATDRIAALAPNAAAAVIEGAGHAAHLEQPAAAAAAILAWLP